MSDQNPTPEQLDPGRRADPNPVQGEVPPSCLSAAAHVGACDRCREALRAHIDSMVAAYVEALCSTPDHQH